MMIMTIVPPNSFLVLFPESYNNERKLSIRLKHLGIENGSKDNNLYKRYSEQKSLTISDLDPFAFEKQKAKIVSMENNDNDKFQLIPSKVIAPKEQVEDGNKKLVVKKVIKKEGYEVKSVGRFNAQNQVPILSTSSISMQLSIPKGVPFDKLNELDKVLYSFYRRAQKSFQSAIYRQFYDFSFSNPHFPDLLMQRTESVSGKLIYSKDGSLQRVISLRSSQFDMLEDAFMNSLQDVPYLQNIPNFILNEEDELQLKITLNIN